ncbi:MAG TPA: hypothetical protein DCD99_11440 [Acinetobacter schindleri]|nr:hypothetical protein [Acinetobacter schindleri]
MKFVSPMGQLRPVFADKNGKRLSGGKVFTYEPGTLTPKATYTDALNLIPNTNPIDLNKYGEADIFLDGDYRIRVVDRHGVLIDDYDNLMAWATKRYLDLALSGLASGASKFYPTLAGANADIANIAVNQVVNIGELENGGLWFKESTESTTLTKAPYDTLELAKQYSNQKQVVQEQYINDLFAAQTQNVENLINQQGVSLQQLDEYYNYLMQRLAQIAVDKGWDASFVVDGDKNQHQINDITTQNTSSINSLRLFKPRKDGQVVNVLSHRAGFNLGGGLFKWDAENTQDDNNFNVIAVSGIAAGRFIRVLNGSIASIEDAGGLSGEDVSSAVNSLLDANIKTITGQTGATYTVNAVTLNKGVCFLGDFTITKPNKDARMFNVHTGNYALEWDGVKFDGKYAGDGVEGAEDIVVTQTTLDGLIVNFKNCKHDNISKKFFLGGYNAIGKIKEFNSIKCGGNGNHMYRGNGEERFMYELHYTSVNIIGYSETGDGIYSESNNIVTRMPMPVLFSTWCKVKIENPILKKHGGFTLYKGCDDAVLINPDLDEVVYPFRVQQAANTSITGGSITNCPYSQGAVTWQPYARINTELRRVEEGLSGLFIDGTKFKGNVVDVNPIGDHLYSGLHGVADCRARGVRVNAIFNGARDYFVLAQDAECDLKGSSLKLSATQSEAFRHRQTATNGAGRIGLKDTTWDGTARSSLNLDANIIVYADLLTGLVQSNIAIDLIESRLHNMRCESQYMLYYRKAGRIKIQDNDWTGVKPKLLAIIRDNDYVTIKNNRGFTYPMNSTNGGLINFADAATLKYIDMDIGKTSDYSPSELYSAAVPTYTTLAVGSVATLPAPVAGGNLEYIYTSAGWKLSSAIQA